MFYNETNVKLRVFNFALCSSSATTAASMLHNINERPHFLQKRKTTSAAKSHCRCRTFAPWATVFVSAPDPRNVFSLCFCRSLAVVPAAEKLQTCVTKDTRDKSDGSVITLSTPFQAFSFSVFFHQICPFQDKKQRKLSSTTRCALC